MANRFWVGGTAAWDSTAGTKWALTSGGAGGQAVPLATDDVFIDANSGAVTITGSVVISRALDFTGFTGTFTLSATAAVSGNVTLATGMTVGGAFTVAINASLTWRSNGKVIPWALSLINVANTVLTFADDFSSTSGLSLTIVANCKIDAAANNVNVTCGNLTMSASSDEIKFGTGIWTITGSGTCVSITTGTITPSSSTIKLTNATGTAKTFAGGGRTYNNVWFAGVGTGTYTITGANTFNNLKCDGGPGRQVLFTSGVTQTVTSMTMGSVSGSVLLTSVTPTSTYTVSTASPVAPQYVGIRDMTKAGVGSITVRNGLDLGGNSGVTFVPNTPTPSYQAGIM